MTNQVNALRFDSILENVKANSSKQALVKLAQHVSKMIGTPEDFLILQLLKHEKEQTSGIGNGVALPHLRLPRLTKPMNVFMTLSNDVDFHAADGEPVDLICLILSPEFEGTRHLSRLASITRSFSNQSFCHSLRCVESAEEIRFILKDINDKKIAA